MEWCSTSSVPPPGRRTESVRATPHRGSSTSTPPFRTGGPAASGTRRFEVLGSGISGGVNMVDQPDEAVFDSCGSRIWVFQRREGVVFEYLFPRKVRVGCIATIIVMSTYPTFFGFLCWTDVDRTGAVVHFAVFLVVLPAIVLFSMGVLQQVFPRRVIWSDTGERCRTTNIPGLSLSFPESDVEAVELLVIHSVAGVRGYTTLALKNRKRRIRLLQYSASSWTRASRPAAVDRVLTEMQPLADTLANAIGRPVRKFRKAKSSWLSWF